MWNPNSYADTDYGLDKGEQFEPDAIEDLGSDVSDDQPHVMTLLGPILPEELGICLPHVHLLCAPSHGPEDSQLNDPERAEAEIETFITMNGRSLVECSTPDMGRKIHALLEIAGWVPAHLIGVTGRHVRGMSGDGELDAELLTHEFERDLVEGMDGSAARAGAIFLGVGKAQMSHNARIAITAAAIASQRTGAPITTQVQDIAAALPLLSALADADVALARVTVGGVDRIDVPVDRHLEILATDAFLQFDQIGTSDDYSDQLRAERIVALCEHGYANQLLLSLDYDRRSLQTAWDGQPGLSYLSEWFMVLLMECGLDALTIRQLVVDNPRRALTIQPPA